MVFDTPVETGCCLLLDSLTTAGIGLYIDIPYGVYVKWISCIINILTQDLRF